MRKTTKTPSRKSSPAVSTLLVTIGAIVASANVAAAEVSAGTATVCPVKGDNSAAFASSTNPRDVVDDPSLTGDAPDKYLEHCHIWPLSGVPPEHRDDACDRSAQNARWAAEAAEASAAPPEDLIPDSVYLSMPEEKTWACPMDDGAAANNGIRKFAMDGFGGGATGHPTKWILHNEASTPIVLAHVNALGLEVSATDFATHPAHASTAAYPHGPIVLPGQMAVIEGLQGQTFVAREYREVLPMDAMISDNYDDAVQHSLKSFVGVLPPTLSFLPERTRYETSGGVLHVLGRPGRVLMKHRMGNIYVRNQLGAVCPESLGLEGPTDVDDGRRGPSQDMNPDCNVLRKAWINRVGCPVDIYFAPQNKIEGYNCERFSQHLGALEPFLACDAKTRDIDAHSSPLKFENTYNGHSFVARMAHDQSLVARIDLDHDVVRDCPEPTRSGALGAEVRLGERLFQEVPVDIIMSSNMTESEYELNVWLAGAKPNATTASPVLLVRKTYQEKKEILWHNRTAGIVTASVPIAS